MGAGDSIGFGITISGPLPVNASEPPQNPVVAVTSDWEKYSIPTLGLKLRYPPNWHVRDMSPASLDYKIVMFGANNFDGSFTIQARIGESAAHWPRGINDEGPELSCAPSHYQISGVAAEQCVISGEQVGDGICRRSIYSEAINTSRYTLRFEPGGGTISEASGALRLTNQYEKILETIEIHEDQ